MRFLYPELTQVPWYGPNGQIQATLVGWITSEWHCGAGRDDALLRRLSLAIVNGFDGAHTCNPVRSIQYCPVCSGRFLISGDGLVIGGFTDVEFRVACDLAAEQGRHDVLGHSELWVRRGSGGWYVAPTLIAHYADAHGYAPPEEFVVALCQATDNPNNLKPGYRNLEPG